MENLNLPIIKINRSKDKRLSMDDYLKFVLNNLKLNIKINSTRESKKRRFVGVYFVLK